MFFLSFLPFCLHLIYVEDMDELGHAALTVSMDVLAAFLLACWFLHTTLTVL
jgi:hypothetical protein